MILEGLFLLAISFLVVVFFYKQRQTDLTILQMEAEQMSQLADLLSEQQPLVIRGVSPPKGLTHDALQKIPRLADFPVGGQPLSAVLESPKMLASAGGLPALDLRGRQELAEELSVPVWATHTWLQPLAETTWVGKAVGTLRTEVVLGGVGMFRTTAIYTMILPTSGTYSVSLLSRASEPFLPANWHYRYPSSLGPNDTPLVADLRFMDILLRPGTALVLPPHMVISMEPTADSPAFVAATILEYHEPISLLNKMISGE